MNDYNKKANITPISSPETDSTYLNPTSLNPTYLSSITDQSLKDKLLQVSNIPILEYLLNFAINDRIDLNNLKKTNQFDLGKKIKERDLEELLSDVKARVDSFLEVENIENPHLNYYSPFKWPLSLNWGSYAAIGFSSGIISYTIGVIPGWSTIIMGALTGACLGINIGRHIAITKAINRNFYVPDNLEELLRFKQNLLTANTIYLEKSRLTRVVGALTHEYVHHVQSKIMENNFNHRNIFVEGHARGVSRKICLEYAVEKENPAYMEMPCIFDFCELAIVYMLMCKMLGVRIRPDLIIPNLFNCHPGHHAIGNALMLIQEIKNGPDIYKKMLKGEHEF